MKRIRIVLGLDRNDRLDRDTAEAGFTLIEVIVAMLIFSIISIGVALSITNSLVITHASQARAIASNLATSDLDLQRSISDVFSIDSGSYTRMVQGITFTVTRTATWVPSSTSSDVCGTGTGTLQYRSVSDSVTYPGMKSAPIVLDTIIAPNGRISDPSLGTIIVAVTGASGAGVGNVSISVTKAPTPNGAIAPTQPSPTDPNGCTYALRVTPGNYTVTATMTNGIDINQQNVSTLTAPVTVTAGTSSPAAFTYDTNALYTFKYATNYTPAQAKIPTNLDTTVNSTTSGNYTANFGTSTPATKALFPFTSGYSYEAGIEVDPILNDKGVITNPTKVCLDSDPGNWTTPNAAGQVGTSFSTPTAAAPGGSQTVNVPMGVVQLPPLAAVSTITATRVNTTANGDPGCAVSTSYTFGSISGTPLLALPFGTWKFTATFLGVLNTAVTPAANANLTGGTVNSDGSVTFDPRGVTP